jgi:hypothetical protein
MLHVQDDAGRPFLDPDRLLSCVNQQLRILYTELAHAPSAYLFAEHFFIQGAYLLGRRVVSQDEADRFAYHLFDDRLEFGEDEEDQLLHLVEQGRALPYMSFPCIVEPSQVSCISFRNDDTESPAELDYIGDHPGILVVRLAGRVVVYLFSASSYASDSPGRSSLVYP